MKYNCLLKKQYTRQLFRVELVSIVQLHVASVDIARFDLNFNVTI